MISTLQWYTLRLEDTSRDHLALWPPDPKAMVLMKWLKADAKECRTYFFWFTVLKM